jgi:ubiquinone biosynthesis protein
LIISAQEKLSSPTLKLRQREVEQRLAMFGLRSGPHRLMRKGVGFEVDHIRRLCTVLKGLGPIFSSFGIYMSTRVDLLRAKDCLELAALPDQAEESSSTAVLNLIRHELGGAPGEVYRDFEERPFVSGLFDQQHRAWLHDGQPVTVRLVHPEAEELLHCDLKLLHLLQPAFIRDELSSFQIQRAIDDFGLLLQQRVDLAAPGRALSRLARDMEVFGILRVPFVHEELTTSKVLTIERLPGQNLEQILARDPATGTNLKGIGEEEERYDLAHRLCLAWLRQAFLGTLFPAEPTPANITVLPNGQIAFTDGAFADLPADAKANLWEYLVAVVMEMPDRACSLLLKEMENGRGPVGEDDLRQRFRQLVPFRDSEWDYGSDNNNLAEYLFLHWRLTSRSGHVTRAHLPSFYRGLFMISTISQRLAPNRDALRDSLQNVRVLAGAERFREMLSIREFGNQMDKYLAVLPDLPQTFDDAMTLMADGNPGLRLARPGRAGHQVQKNTVVISIVLLMALASCVVISHRLAASGVMGAWIDGASGLMFLLLGAMLLRAVTR